MGNANKVIDALSTKCLILWEFQVKTLGFEHLKEMYCDDPYFKEAYESCAQRQKPVDRVFDSRWIVFKGCQL